MFVRFTERARRAIVLAREEAGRLRHDVVGPEHLLLGLVRIGDSSATEVLRRLGVSLEAVEGEVRRVLGDVAPARKVGEIPFSPEAKRVLELAIESAREPGLAHVGSEHVLIGILKQGQSAAAKILGFHGVQAESVRRVLEEGDEVSGQPLTPAVGGLVHGRGVCLAVLGADLDPEALSQQLGCLPTQTRRRDEARRPGTSPPSTGAWLLEVFDAALTGPEQMIAALLARLPTDADLWGALAAEFDVQLRVRLHVEDWSKGFELSPDTVSAIARLQARVILDVYGDDAADSIE
jgi:hypothetical protein